MNSDLKFKVNYINQVKGFGVFTQLFIPSSTYICEYIGEVFSNLTCMLYKKQISQKSLDYTMIVNENDKVSCVIVSHLFGNISRFFNHSCETPNLSLEIVRIKYTIPRVAFYASRDIQPGEELSFKYNEDK